MPSSRPVSPARNDEHWWRQAVVYQVYPRSFADASGDGIGDVRGITSRADYLASLGVDAVWVSPFYPSALADGGYDVDDYRDVDPVLGTLEDFDELVAALHARGVARHRRHRARTTPPTGTRGSAPRWPPARAHPSASATSSATAPGPTAREPPSDWESVFGGPAWERVPDGQWYLHMFAPEQPDFNWDHPEVREDFLAHPALLVRPRRRRLPRRRRALAGQGPRASRSRRPPSCRRSRPRWAAHPLWDQDGVHEVYAEWRRVLDEYDPPRTAVAEAWVHRSRLAPYAHPTGLGQAFTFDLLDAPWDAAAFREIVSDVLDGHHDSGSSSTWVLSNHDVVRHASRYGLPQGDRAAISEAWLGTDGPDPALDREAGLRRARAATLFMLALPGSAYLYQGEELGLHEVADLPAEALQDPTWERSGHTVKGRDGCRVPIPWTTDGPSFGFGDAAAAPAAAGLVRRGRRGRPGGRPELDAGALPRGAAAAPRAAGRRGADLALRAGCAACSTWSGPVAGAASPTWATRPSTCPRARCC